MTDQPELKPCPFCGNQAKMRNVEMAGCSYVSCTLCKAQTEDASQQTAARYWNTRTPPKVKPLVWDGKFAHTGMGLFYAADQDHDGVVLARVEGSGETKSFHKDMNDAKASAQADYDRRILGALE